MSATAIYHVHHRKCRRKYGHHDNDELQASIFPG